MHDQQQTDIRVQLQVCSGQKNALQILNSIPLHGRSNWSKIYFDKEFLTTLLQIIRNVEWKVKHAALEWLVGSQVFMGCGLGKLAFIDWNGELVNMYFYLYAVSYYLTIFSYPFLTHRSFFLFFSLDRKSVV